MFIKIYFTSDRIFTILKIVSFNIVKITATFT